MDQAATKAVGKLDESVLKVFGQGSVSSISRSSSDTGSEGAVCSRGPNKKVCGNPVKEEDLGVHCDRCHEWFHAACQGIPKTAIQALERFADYLAWVCAKCKSDLNNRKERPPLLAPLESKVAELERVIRGTWKWLTVPCKFKSRP